MGRFEAAKGYLAQARKAGHHAVTLRAPPMRQPSPAWRHSCVTTHLTALDTAAAARSLAARTADARLKALAEHRAAAAYALDGQHGPSMVACARAQGFLASSGVVAPESLAYWVHEGTLDSHRNQFLCLLGKPREAVNAASNAKARFDRTYVGSYGRCQVRLGHALVLSKEITETAHVLGDAASHASLSPRTTAELHATRALLQLWEHTAAVKTLDTQLEACGLLINTPSQVGESPGGATPPGDSPGRRVPRPRRSP